MTKKYDSSWDDDESEDDSIQGSEEAFDKIYADWEKRSWEPWLRNKLRFPFSVKRMEDEGEALFSGAVKSDPFSLGCIMEVSDIENEDDHYGIILKVREGTRVGHVPLCDVEVTTKESENYWPVREYVVWFANH